MYTYDGAGNRDTAAETYTSAQQSDYVDPVSNLAVKYIVKNSNYFYSNSDHLLKLVEKMYANTSKLVLTKTTDYLNDNNGNELREKISFIVPFDRSMRQQTAADPYGNTTTDAISSLIEKVTNTFDGFNRLKTETKVKSGVRVVVKYTYNGDGLRTQKAVTSSKDNNTTKTTNYLYDRQHVILETDQSGQLLTRYIRGVNYLARMDSSNQLYNYLYNGHGDVVQTVTEAGVVENQYDYDIFGSPILTEEQHSNAIRYAGEFYDVETGLYYLRARYYNPYIGRFISEDSVWGEDTNPLSLNLYTYVHNDPINFIDPTGHLEQGDNQLSEADQNKIKDLTDAYFSADTQKEKDKIHAEAQSIRDNAKKDTSKSGDSFAQDANSAIKNSKHVDSNGKSYITGSEWRSLSKKHHRRSGGVSQQMEQRHEEQSLNSHHIAKHTLTQTINAIESQAENNMDYTIGSTDYAQSISLMAKEIGVKPMHEFVFNDVINHTSEFMAGQNEQSSKEVSTLSYTTGANKNKYSINSLAKNYIKEALTAFLIYKKNQQYAQIALDDATNATVGTPLGVELKAFEETQVAAKEAEEFLLKARGTANPYDLLKQHGIPSTLSKEEINAANATDLKMEYKGAKNVDDSLDWSTTTKKGETRVKHVNKHGVDNINRDNHGVFNNDPVKSTNDAWSKRSGVAPIDDGMGGEIYNIPYKDAGYEGGKNGTGESLNYVTIVVEKGANKLITAFPSNGGYGIK